MTFRDVLYTSIIGPQTTSQWDTANITVIEVLALGAENVMKSHCEYVCDHFVLYYTWAVITLIWYRGCRSLPYPELSRRCHDTSMYRPLENSWGRGKSISRLRDYSTSPALQKLGIITFQQKQVMTAETVQYHLIKFHNKKDYRHLVKTLSEIRTYFYTSFQVQTYNCHADDRKEHLLSLLCGLLFMFANCHSHQALSRSWMQH